MSKKQSRKLVPLNPHSAAQCYSPAQVDTIFSKINLKAGADRNQVHKKIELIGRSACHLYRILANEEVRRPSERARKMRSLGSLSTKMLTTLQEDLKEGYLERIGRDLAARGDPPPGCREEMIPTTCPCRVQLEPTPFWPVEDQLLQFRKMLAWMIRCTDEAVARSEQEKGNPGNRAEEHLELLVEGIAHTFDENSAEPADYQCSGSSHEAQGNLIDFAEACLAPLQGRSSGDRYFRRSIFDRLTKLRSKTD